MRAYPLDVNAADDGGAGGNLRLRQRRNAGRDGHEEESLRAQDRATRAARGGCFRRSHTQQGHAKQPREGPSQPCTGEAPHRHDRCAGHVAALSQTGPLLAGRRQRPRPVRSSDSFAKISFGANCGAHTRGAQPVSLVGTVAIAAAFLCALVSAAPRLSVCSRRPVRVIPESFQYTVIPCSRSFKP